jgi:hypothetical protein
MGIVTGREAGPNEVIRYVDSPITTPLTNTATLAPPAERYSFSFNGNAQSLDHMVVNQAVLDDFAGVHAEHARINADFGIDNYGDFTVPVRVSDHDPVVLFLGEASFRTSDLSISISSDSEINPGSPATFSATVFNSGPDVVAGAKVDFAISRMAGSFFMLPPQGWSCGQPQSDGGAGFLVHCNAETFASQVAATFNATLVNTWPGGTVVNIGAAIMGSATDPVAANNTAASQISAVNFGDMSLFLSPVNGSSYVSTTTPIEMVLLIDNVGQSTSDPTSVAVTFDVPASLVTFVPFSFGTEAGIGVVCTAITATGAQTSRMDCQLPAMTPRLTRGVRFSIAPPPINGSVSRVVTVHGVVTPSFTERTPANNSVTEQVTFEFGTDNRVLVSSGFPEVSPPMEAIFLLSVFHAGLADPIHPSLLLDLNAGGLTWPARGNCSIVATPPAGHTQFVCPVSPAGQNLAVRIPLAQSFPDQVLTLTATVSDDLPDTAPDNNTNSANVSVRAIADLVACLNYGDCEFIPTPAESPRPLIRNSLVHFGVQNFGPSNAKYVRVEREFLLGLPASRRDM